MSVPVLGDGSKQDEEQKRVERMAKGEVPGLKSSRYTIQDMGELMSTVASAGSDKKKQLALLYALAGLRDAPYSAAGRKYMRVACLNTRYRISYMRALMFAYQDLMTEK